MGAVGSGKQVRAAAAYSNRDPGGEEDPDGITSANDPSWSRGGF